MLYKKYFEKKIKMIELLTLFLLLLLVISGYLVWRLKQKLSIQSSKSAKQHELLMRGDRLSEVGSMMGNIAHQWKQPLNNIALLVLNIENAHRKKQLTSEYLEDKIYTIEDTLEYMSQTIEDFSDYLSPTKKRHLFYINDSVEKAIELTMPTLNRSKVDIIFLAEDDYEFLGRKNELTQVIIILINNARDALLKDIENQNKSIEINLDKVDEVLELSIQDNGQGVAQELFETIFDPYYTTNNDTKGRGLGLYMAKMIVEGLDGTINLYNDNGAVFTLRF